MAARSAEVDSFTHRRPLADSAPALNAVVNRWMARAVEEANRPPMLLTGEEEEEILATGCDSDRLESALVGRLVGFIVGPLESLVNHSRSLDVIRVPFEQSIYRDFQFKESPVISLTRRMATLVRIGDVYVGSDKFGHFFTEGHTYYRLYATAGRRSALTFGEVTESTFYGELTTGIFSFADLAANLNGLRFWNEIEGRLPDPLTGRPVLQPYVECRLGRWHLTRRFDWRDYVDPAWDEAVNCSDFRNDELLQKVRRRIAAATGGRQCPLEQVDRKRLARKYGDLLPLVFNPDGNRVFAGRLRPKIERLLASVFDRFLPEGSDRARP